MKSNACGNLRKAAMLLFYILPQISISELRPTHFPEMCYRTSGPSDKWTSAAHTSQDYAIPIVLLIRLDIVGSLKLQRWGDHQWQNVHTGFVKIGQLARARAHTHKWAGRHTHRRTDRLTDTHRHIYTHTQPHTHRHTPY
jgi:hypothetical protein